MSNRQNLNSNPAVGWWRSGIAQICKVLRWCQESLRGPSLEWRIQPSRLADLSPAFRRGERRREKWK